MALCTYAPPWRSRYCDGEEIRPVAPFVMASVPVVKWIRYPERGTGTPTEHKLFSSVLVTLRVTYYHLELRKGSLRVGMQVNPGSYLMNGEAGYKPVFGCFPTLCS